MKKTFLLVFSLGFITAVFCLSTPTLKAAELELPQPIGFVNDFVGILPPNEKLELETALKEFESETSNEIVVAVVGSFQGLDPFSYSQKLFTAWGIGKKDTDNGILMVIGPDGNLPFPDRGKIFINVGRGLEGAMPDSLTGTIIRREMIPSFKEKDPVSAILLGVVALMDATRGEYLPSPEETQLDVKNVPWDFLIILGFFIFSYIASFLGRSKSWWLGGVLGGGGGFVLGLVLFSIGGALVAAALLGLAGTLFDYIVSRTYQDRLKKGLPTDFWHSRGGFWGGGFGGGSGGGFGGFGGGSSGGGGAGGSW